MIKGIFRKLTCLAALAAFGVASAPRVQAAPAVSAAAGASSSSAATVTVVPATGRGWGSIFACAGCAVAAAVVVAGGPGAILVAINTPGSAIAAMACAASCYEAF